MAKLQPALVSQPPLMHEPQGGENELLGSLPHDQMQYDRNGDKSASDKQRQIHESHFFNFPVRYRSY